MFNKLINITFFWISWNFISYFLLFSCLTSSTFNWNIYNNIRMREEDSFFKINRTIVKNKSFIFIIGNSTTVLCLTDHIFQLDPIKVQRILLLVETQLRHYFIKMTFEVHKGSFKIGIVELIRNTPTNWTELSSFKNNGMEESHDVYQSSPVFVFDSF